MKKKKAPPHPPLAVLVLVVLAVLLGALGGYALHPAGITPAQCTERMLMVGGPQVAIAIVCQGASFPAEHP